MAIPIIDLFAGPGGLGEGFSNNLDKNAVPNFEIRLSIEKEDNAHKTLTLRSFLRQFTKKGMGFPNEYYEAIRTNDINEREKQLEIVFEKYNSEYSAAKIEAQKIELGVVDEEIVDRKISTALNGEQDWVLIGGPPCQAYSLVGRSRNQWKSEVDEEDSRVYLYKEYLRIIAAHKPAVFVMENVKGLLSAKVNGEKIFNLIKRDLRNPSKVFTEYECPEYEIHSFVTSNVKKDQDYLIRSENYGIPQKRHRVILLGIRKGFTNQKPGILKLQDKLNLSDVISDLPKIRSEFNRKVLIGSGDKKRQYERISDSDSIWEDHVNEFFKTIISTNGFSREKFTQQILAPQNGTGGEYIEWNMLNTSRLNSWYSDKKIAGVINHKSRSHLYSDVKRYLFSAIYSNEYRRFPRLIDYLNHAKELLPDHKNASSGKFNDRFRVQLENIPATTITSHISKDGHYFIHYDYTQCRSLTVREAARVQTFPDNYLFRGARTAQYHQVGNAVPPYLAYQISDIIKGIF